LETQAANPLIPTNGHWPVKHRHIVKYGGAFL